MHVKWITGIPIGLLLAGAFAARSYGQEQIVPITHNPSLYGRQAENVPARKITALTLPFFEDFTGYDEYPDPVRWTDRKVYINNTMGDRPVSRGVATFDAIDETGLPYNMLDPFAVVYADSLTSQVIDLGALLPSDSIYLSFFYQPQGNGFAPETGDSLLLYFKKKHGPWTKVWSQAGTTLHEFRQVMIAVNDTAYLNDAFQLRFVNIASINLNDDIWNLDYIRMDKNRTMLDTAVNDIAASVPASSLLKEYTFMPYRQFLANTGRERAATHRFSVRNNYASDWNVNYGYTAIETVSNTPLGNDQGSGSIAAWGEKDFSFPVYSNTVPMAGRYDPVVFEQKYFVSPVSTADRRENDTIVHRQVFDNYLAYDDGTAEKSYFLNLYPTLPGKIAIEYYLNEPDTLRGVAIYFGRQVPSALGKFFSAVIYESIAVNGARERIVYQQDLLEPGYASGANHFWIYKFDDPVPMPAGAFYLGITQPALSGGDSLYYGLDVNRTGANYLYYNVLDNWQSSGVSGALMVRPLLGQAVTGSGTGKDERLVRQDWNVVPNPVRNGFYLEDADGRGLQGDYQLRDMTGRVVKQGTLRPGEQVDAAALSPGMYILQLKGGRESGGRKLIKL